MGKLRNDDSSTSRHALLIVEPASELRRIVAKKGTEGTVTIFATIFAATRKRGQRELSRF